MTAREFWDKWIKTDLGLQSYECDPMRVCRIKFAEAYAKHVREQALEEAAAFAEREWGCKLIAADIRALKGKHS